MFNCSYVVISALAKTTEELEYLMKLQDVMDGEVIKHSKSNMLAIKTTPKLK